MNMVITDIVFRVLIHSIWISLAVFLLTKAALYLFSRSNSALRYRISVAAMLIYVISIVATAIYFIDSNVSRDLEKFNFQQLFAGAMDETVLSQENHRQGSTEISYWITLLYFLGVTVFFFKSVIQFLVIKNEIRQSSLVPVEYQETMKKLMSRIGIHRRVKLVESVRIHSPALFGMVKPVIIVPAGIIGNMPFNQVEAILLHELMHIRRYDFLINILQNLVETLFFFNPFVWMLSTVIKEERELYCDDGVLASGSDPGTYVRALYAVSISQKNINALALAAGGTGKHHLLYRVKRILKSEPMKNKMRPGVFLATLIVAGMATIISLSAFESPLFTIEKEGNNAKEMEYDRPYIIPDTVDIDTVIEVSNLKDERKHIIIDSDSLTDEEKEELKMILEDVHAQLDSTDWDAFLDDLEETKLELLQNMPEMLQEELLRVQEQLSTIDEEAIRKQMEEAREQMRIAMENFDVQDIQVDIDASMKDLQEMLKNEDMFSEEELQVLREDLEKIKEIDLEDIRKDMEDAMKDLEIDMNFDFDFDFDLDSVMKEIEISFESIDVEEIRRSISESVIQVEAQLKEISEKEN